MGKVSYKKENPMLPKCQTAEGLKGSFGLVRRCRC